jgi:molybdopterin-synthase adenylyltransferase
MSLELDHVHSRPRRSPDIGTHGSTAASTNRHRRQELLGWLGETGQRKLSRSTVLITRVGGLGGPLAQSLALAGVGRIVLFHEGFLIEEDLHRMMLMDPGGVGMPRAPQARASLERMAAPGACIEAYRERITPGEARRWMPSVDLAIGAAPTYEERLLLGDAAREHGKPFVDAAMYDDEAQLLCVHPTDGPCLRCLVPEPPRWREDFPVLAAVSATIGNLAAYHCVRILAGAEPVPWGELVHLDMEQMALKKTRLSRRPGCPSCAKGSNAPGNPQPIGSRRKELA